MIISEGSLKTRLYPAQVTSCLHSEDISLCCDSLCGDPLYRGRCHGISHTPLRQHLGLGSLTFTLMSLTALVRPKAVDSPPGPPPMMTTSQSGTLTVIASGSRSLTALKTYNFYTITYLLQYLNTFAHSLLMNRCPASSVFDQRQPDAKPCALHTKVRRRLPRY